MSALAFLAKKSWNLKNMVNEEAVWLAEEREAAEKKRLAELEKELMKERKEMEFRKLQAEAGLAPKNVKERLDWMYKDGGKKKAAKTEDELDEYLMGKQIEDADEDKALKAVISSSGGATSSAGATAVSSKWLNATNDSNERFRGLHEDPMFFISKQQKEQLEKAKKTQVLARRMGILSQPSRQLLATRSASSEQPIWHNRSEKKKRKERKNSFAEEEEEED